MQALRQFTGVEAAQLSPGPLHLAVGMFDGVHLGHRAVIQPAVAAARREQGNAGVLTFAPHPSALFRPENPTRLIQPLAAKAEALAALGVDALITQPFTAQFAALPAEAFLGWLKQHLPGLAAVYVGENFRFGCGRRGDAALLEKSGPEAGVRVVIVPGLTVGAERVSSTRIRAHLAAGEIEAANALLGRPYRSSGVVQAGKRLGRTIGVPTLNLHWSPDLRPRFGVYAVRVMGTKSERALDAVANYGLRPTVEESVEPKLEAHVLGDCPYDAGDVVSVDWLRFLRPEQTFAGLAALRAQIEADKQAAREALATIAGR